jgi:hypothetical protein
MSTKIYNGTRIPYMNTLELMKFLRGLKPKFEKAVQKEIDATTIRLSVHEYDKRTLGLSDKMNEGIYSVVDSSMTSIFMGDPSRKLEAWQSTKTEVILFPMKNKILTLFFGDRDYEKIWNKVKGVKFYGYWDNTDEDEECSKQEWKQREKDWEEVLVGDDKSGIPAMEGFIFQFTTNNLWHFTYGLRSPRRKAACLKYVPDMENRLTRMAEVVVDKEAHKKGEVNTNAVMTYLSSDDRKKKIAEEKEKLRGKLVEFKHIDEIFSKKWETPATTEVK